MGELPMEGCRVVWRSKVLCPCPGIQVGVGFIHCTLNQTPHTAASSFAKSLSLETQGCLLPGDLPAMENKNQHGWLEKSSHELKLRTPGGG